MVTFMDMRDQEFLKRHMGQSQVYPQTSPRYKKTNKKIDGRLQIFV